MKWSIICALILGPLVMGIACRLLGEWNSIFNKNSWAEWVGRIVFWGGGTALTSIIGGMPLKHALVIIPMGISCAIIPPPNIFVGILKQEILLNVFYLIICGLISFIPMGIVFWVNGYFWPKLVVISCLLPLIYYICLDVKFTKIWKLETSEHVTEFMVGAFLGFDIICVVLLKDWYVWPKIPDFLQIIKA